MKINKKFNVYISRGILFHLIYISMFGCNIDYSKKEMTNEMDNYFQIYNEDLEYLTDWCIKMIDVDTSYEISHDRTPEIYYHYIEDDSTTAKRFYPKKNTPDRFKKLMTWGKVSKVYKWKNDNYFKFKLGPVYRSDYLITILILKKGKKLDESFFLKFKPYSIRLFLDNDIDDFIYKKSNRFYFLIQKFKNID